MGPPPPLPSPTFPRPTGLRELRGRVLVSWKIPAAAKVSVCRHSLAWSQACLPGQLPPAYPRGWLCTGALKGSPGLLVLEARGCRGNQLWSVGDYM